jgi:DNA invertase Pin-like site-specific DNA recombinase
MSKTPILSQKVDLADAKARREQAAEAKARSIRRMHADGVPLREIAEAMRTSRSQVEKVLARGKS